MLNKPTRIALAAAAVLFNAACANKPLQMGTHSDFTSSIDKAETVRTEAPKPVYCDDDGAFMAAAFGGGCIIRGGLKF